MKNYRSVPNLTFVFKVVERLISERLVGFQQENNLMPVEQSANRQHHSTETALLRVILDLLSSMDKQEVTLLGLLDLSATFDCVNHDILLTWLECTIGITGSAFNWIRPDAASDIPRTTVRRHEGDLRCPTRFRAWTTSIPSVHGRIAGYNQEEGHEGSFVCKSISALTPRVG